MQYSRCKCGEHTAWDSGMPPAPCHVCEKCGSTLAWHPDYHAEPIPHDLEIEFDHQHKLTALCSRCYGRFKLADAPKDVLLKMADHLHGLIGEINEVLATKPSTQ